MLKRPTNILFLSVMLVGLSTLPDAWALTAAPTTLSFQAVQNGSSPASQTVSVLKNNNRVVSLTSTDNAIWLSASPTTGTITNSAQISVTVNPAGLAPGSYSGTVTVTASKGGSVSIPVALTVTPQATPTSVNPSSTSTAALTWNPSASTNVAGYKVYMGTVSGGYGSSVNVGKVTSYTMSNLGVGSTYYFAVTSFDSTGLESGFSNEVSKSVY
jgi:hypothetical protein